MNRTDRTFQRHYPFQSHFVEIDGALMHYIDEGHGPALVLCHGNPTWSFYFRNIISGLRDRFRVIALDHIGCGLSEKPRDYAYRLGRHVANVGHLIEHLHLDRVSIGGHDWGGAIAMGWATRNPQKVRSIVLFNTAAFFGPTPLRIRVAGLPVIGEVGVLGLNLFAKLALQMAVRHPQRLRPEVRRGLLMPYPDFGSRRAILSFVRDIPTSPNRGSVSMVGEIEANLACLARHPMVIFWGKQDFCFHGYFLDEWKRRFPRAAVHEFEDAGHYVVEDAHERIVPLLHEFLLETAGQGVLNTQAGSADEGAERPAIESTTAATSRISTR